MSYEQGALVIGPPTLGTMLVQAGFTITVLVALILILGYGLVKWEKRAYEAKANPKPTPPQAQPVPPQPVPQAPAPQAPTPPAA